LGFPSGLSGLDLARRAVAQARRFEVEILSPQEALNLRIDGPYRHIKLSDGAEISCHALLLAMGVQWRALDVPGIERLQGAGVYYGGGASEAIACKAKQFTSWVEQIRPGKRRCTSRNSRKKVIMLVRGGSLASTMSHYLIEQIDRLQTFDVWTHTR